ncbi:metallophosphoesterase [uncultured Cyclobacterium sp.]|uniref:metallophosphoesterase family protein n=1 Tax=uncultured Cyclobacterium sp. TaxID=453820 RepID=UPI0030EC01A4|tara:strand:- start:365 stop:1372 length:1008 start_codon:yes stop_codon:yes gene_type:complete
MKRRKFVHQLGAGSLLAALPFTSLSFKTNAASANNAKTLRFGLVADVHKDLIPDANQRLEEFIDKAITREVDMVIQLGDFCMGDSKNRDFMGIWETFKAPKYHVLGNHDMDRNSKQEMQDFWGMPNNYYSYDIKGVHFIVLDANFLCQKGEFIAYKNANFYVDDSLRTYIDDKQIEWFKADLATTKLPTIVLSHQSLWHHEWGVKNRLRIQEIMEAEAEKVICCFNGHNHIDFHRHLNGIDYIEINSMSYQWMGEKYSSLERFPKEQYEKYPNLPHIAAYKDPLYAFVTIDPTGTLTVEGVRSQWMTPTPYDLGMKEAQYGSVATAEISDYKVNF